MPELRRVCLYAGSSPGTDPSYVDAAASLARLLAHRGIGIAYGGLRALENADPETAPRSPEFRLNRRDSR